MHLGTFMVVSAIVLVVYSGGQAAEASFEPQAAGPPPLSRAQESQTTVGEPNGVLTLRDALALALLRNPDLGVFPYTLREADARLLQAGLRPNPQLEFEVEDVGGRRERGGFEMAQTTVSVGQSLELGGKRAKRNRVAAHDKEMLQWDYQSARLDTVRQVARAFAAVLAAQERRALTDRLLELSRQAQAAVAQRVKAGKDSPVEELRADVALAESRIERQKAERALTTARYNLAVTWGGRAPAFEKAEGDFYGTAAPRSPARMSAAISRNPDVARWRTEEQQRRAALQLEKARGVPDVTVGAGLRRYEETDDQALVFGLALPLPLFDRNQG
ncbi:MAG: TolC family protein, partial [Acidobacteria bacterium]